MTAFEYHDGATLCEGYVALPAGAGPHPAVLIAHNWMGQGEGDNAVARKLAAMGYVGIAIDVYGKGVRGGPTADNAALMMPFASDRMKLRQRLLAAVTAAAAHPAIDADRMAFIGYCFGGLCALDMARANAPVRGVASFHGSYGPLGEPTPLISPKVLVLHGWDDPITPPDATLALAHELNAAGADWQLIAYGHTMHSFTNPAADNPAGGMAYSAVADRRSWAALTAFLDELFKA